MKNYVLIIGCFLSFCFAQAQFSGDWKVGGNKFCTNVMLGVPPPAIGTLNILGCPMTQGGQQYPFVNFRIIRGGETMTNYKNNLIQFAPAVDHKVLIGNAPTNTQGSYKLYVETGIMTEKVKVALKTTADWSDYVFSNDYHLMNLHDLEIFIDTNGHLPNIPSAKELVKTGMDLGAMQAKQMAKIEELTLHLIQKNKEINVLQKQVTLLSKQMNLLLEKE